MNVVALNKRMEADAGWELHMTRKRCLQLLGNFDGGMDLQRVDKASFEGILFIHCTSAGHEACIVLP